MTKFVVIDPCYLKHTDKEWDKYCDSCDYDKSAQELTGNLNEVFPNIYGIDIENGIGDISPDECRIDITARSFSNDMRPMDVNLPCCDSGHHRIFALSDIKERLHNEDFAGGVSYDANMDTNFCRTFEAEANDIFDLAAYCKFEVHENHDAREEEPYE